MSGIVFGLYKGVVNGGPIHEIMNVKQMYHCDVSGRAYITDRTYICNTDRGRLSVRTHARIQVS